MTSENLEMYEDAEAAGQLWDELGESRMQPVLDEMYRREPGRVLTGSGADWAALRALAQEMDKE